MRRLQADVAHLKGELYVGSEYSPGGGTPWSQTLHIQTKLLVPDGGLLAIFSQAGIPYDVPETGLVVTGYKLWVPEEWIYTPFRYQRCIVQKTGNENDIVEALRPTHPLREAFRACRVLKS